MTRHKRRGNKMSQTISLQSFEGMLNRIQNIQQRIKEIENLSTAGPDTLSQSNNNANKQSTPIAERQTEFSQNFANNTDNRLAKIIDDKARSLGVSPKLISAMVKVESNGNPAAVSEAGAIGLMQLMPATAKELKVNPYDQEQNLAGGIQYIKDLAYRYQDLDLALAAYNAGPEKVDRYQGVPPYPETQNYIKKIRKILEN